jgi:hypothetical protein
MFICGMETFLGHHLICCYLGIAEVSKPETPRREQNRI